MNWHQKQTETLSFGDAIADALASFIGSWRFVIFQTAIFSIWVLVNTLWFLSGIQWDPYPFILFNLVMSAEAAYSSPLIMMSQNRQGDRDRIHAEQDYQTNLDAKAEIEALQIVINRIETEKLDAITALVTALDQKLDTIIAQPK